MHRFCATDTGCGEFPLSLQRSSELSLCGKFRRGNARRFGPVASDLAFIELVMKKITLFLAALCCLFPTFAASYRVQDIPNVQSADARHYVSNPDGILAPWAVARIDSLCAALRAQGLAEVAVVAVDDIAGGDPFSFAIDLFRQWGVGRADNDNGLGVLLVKNLREIRFVTGGGLEGVLTDALSKRIQTGYMLPAFREGNYSEGMVAGMSAVADLLEGNAPELAAQVDTGEELSGWTVLLLVAVLILVPVGIVAAIAYARKRCPRCHKFTLRLQGQQVVSVTPADRLTEFTFVCSNCGKVVKRQVRSMRDDNIDGRGGGTIIGGFGGFGGGRGIGGGGFGGGSFGGGGAGSRW